MPEEHGLLAHPHTSVGRVPTDAGQRYYDDRLLLVVLDAPFGLELQLILCEVDEAMRVTTETLSQVTNLLAIVSAPPVHTATIRHVEVLGLQPQVVALRHQREDVSRAAAGGGDSGERRDRCSRGGRPLGYRR